MKLQHVMLLPATWYNISILTYFNKLAQVLWRITAELRPVTK